MMKSLGSGRPDVHTRSFPNMFHAFEYLNVLGTIAVFHAIFLISWLCLSESRPLYKYRCRCFFSFKDVLDTIYSFSDSCIAARMSQL